MYFLCISRVQGKQVPPTSAGHALAAEESTPWPTHIGQVSKLVAHTEGRGGRCKFKRTRTCLCDVCTCVFMLYTWVLYKLHVFQKEKKHNQLTSRVRREQIVCFVVRVTSFVSRRICDYEQELGEDMSSLDRPALSRVQSRDG